MILSGYMNLKTALTKIQDLETRIKQIEKQTNPVDFHVKSSLSKRIDEIQEPYRIEMAKRTKNVLEETFGMIPKKRATGWLKQIETWRKASRV